ncbi:MAG: hypothetical protein M3O07_08160, partial [Pseudomonadota bacterium]|nr:hypothetical protein [Pseudomonadota bacterium]
MVNLPDRHVAAKWMPVILVAGLVAAFAAALLLFLSGRAQQQELDQRANVAALGALAGVMPSQAAAAARGETAAFAKLDQSRQQLERALAGIAAGRGGEDAAGTADEPAWDRILSSATQVLAARDSAGALRASAAETKTALGRVLAATGEAVSAPGGAVAL